MSNEANVLSTFKASLASGKYEAITGARRAIGKFQGLSEEDRAKAHAMANKHFDAPPGNVKGAPLPKAAAKPAPKAAPTKAMPTKATPAKATATPTEAPKKRGRKPASVVGEQLTLTAVASADNQANMSGKQVEAIERSVSTLRAISAESKGAIKIDEELKAAREAIGNVLRSIGGVANSLDTPAIQKPTVSAPMNGLSAMPSAG